MDLHPCLSNTLGTKRLTITQIDPARFKCCCSLAFYLSEYMCIENNNKKLVFPLWYIKKG